MIQGRTSIFSAFCLLSLMTFGYSLEAELGKNEELAPTASEQELVFLENLIKNNNPVEIHNKALALLKSRQENQALALLKKNAYQHLFPSSYLLLFQMDIPVFFKPLLWHISLLLLSLMVLIRLFLYLKKPGSFHFKAFLGGLSLLSLLFLSGFFLLKPRVICLKESDLKASPFQSAPTQAEVSPNSDLIVLKQTKDWLRVQSPNKQRGWILKNQVFRIF